MPKQRQNRLPRLPPRPSANPLARPPSPLRHAKPRLNYAGVGTRLKTTMQESRHLLDPAVARMLEPALHQRLEDYDGKVFKRCEFREQVRARFESIDLQPIHYLHQKLLKTSRLACASVHL